jgi:ABC-type uncharacterized transport system YnjBCD substrate-binding protein
MVTSQIQLNQVYPKAWTKSQRINIAECWWLKPVILATQEAKIRRIEVQTAQANSSQDSSSKIPIKTNKKKLVG